MPNPFRIFISYAKVDTRDLAFQLRDTFNALPNVVAWMDESLESGEDWALQIQDEIDRADIVVVLLSPDVNRPANHPKGSSFVLKEIHYAQQVRKSILPVMAQQTRVPVQLAGVEYTDLTKDFAAGFSRLVQQISRRAGNPTPPVGTPVLASAAPPPSTTQPSLVRRLHLNESRAIIIGAVITGIFAVIAAFITIVPNLQSRVTAVPSPTTAAVIASNTPSPTDAPTSAPTATDAPTITPIPPTPTPLPTETPIPPSATATPSFTPVPPTDTVAPSPVQIVNQFAAPGSLPNGIACSANGLLLADNSTTLFEIDTSGKLLAVYQSPDPTPVGLGSDGTHFWVQTTNRNLIHEFQINGSQLIAGKSFESPVTVVGGTNDIAWDGNTWWIADQFNLHHLDSAGNRLNPRPFPKTIAAVDWDGTYLWLAFIASPTLSVYDRQGNLIQTFASPIPEIQGLAWCGTDLWAIGRDQIGSPYQVYQLAVAGWQVSPLPTNTAIPPTTIVVTTTPMPNTSTPKPVNNPCIGRIESTTGNSIVIYSDPNKVTEVAKVANGTFVEVVDYQFRIGKGWYTIVFDQVNRGVVEVDKIPTLSSTCPFK